MGEKNPNRNLGKNLMLIKIPELHKKSKFGINKSQKVLKKN